MIIWSIVTQEWNQTLDEICHDFITLYHLSIHQLLSELLAELHAILDSFTGVANTTSIVGGRGCVGSHKVASKGYVITKNSQMVSIGAIFTSIYHTKQLHPWPNSSASHVLDNSQLSACPWDIEPFEGDPSTHQSLRSLRCKPQQTQPDQLSASIPGWFVS